MVIPILVADVYGRLLRRLNAIPIMLLSASVLGEDFLHRWVRGSPRSGVGGDSSYVSLDSIEFQPVLVGVVDEVELACPGQHRLVLKLPPHSTQQMERFFEKQLACLFSAVDERCALTPDVLCEDVIPWCYGDSFVNWRIHCVTAADVIIRRSSPARCLLCLSSDTSSAWSTNSSSTMCSTDEARSTPVCLDVGDLVVMKCRMSCRDFVRPGNSVIRVFTLRVTHLEVIV
ncbi:hypothetical protein C8F04DRAFT_1262922 [Mycena alexandri]|uniref:Uncharacterized protein n=1 Tax=Mycena alexandri TaxID=1745969 RepID=A0AAD6X400_9AGAR|nr:hypothetical protein C8F04DRAFT_1262922 [Mycena alexandri]